MRVGVLSDIHSNKPALEAVLEDLPAVDAIVNAGDIVGYNPWPAECLRTVRNREIPTVMGNHDRAVAGGTAFQFNGMAKAGLEHAQSALTAEERSWLETRPTQQTVFDGRLRLVHGHPEDPDHYTYPEEFGPELLGEEDVLVMGHTHVQHAETYPEGIVLNPGSVGQPRDGDPRAGYAVVDLNDLTVELHRVTYDIETVMEAVTTAGLPRRIGQRLKEGR